MSEVKGHAAFHKHKAGPRHPGTKAGTRAERRALLKESMRHLDPQEVVLQAKKNSNIVTADTHLNVAYVSDGDGGVEVATDIERVLKYGDAREEKTRYLREGSRTVDLFVVHLPKTMCVEIKDFYPRYNPDGSERLDPETGEPMSRSRWVARDPDEAMRYYRDAVDFLGEEVIPGGMDAIHGWVTNDDESTPHIQIMGDPFAPDPKAPGMLRSEASRAYSSHRDVVCPEGTISIHRNKDTRFYRRLGDPMGFAFTPEERTQLEQLTGKPSDQIDLADLKALDGQKLSGGIVRYAEGKPAWGEYKMQSAQGAMRERMIAKGYPVEYEPGEHHGRELPKEVFEEVQDEKAEAASLRAAGHEAIVDAAEAAAAAETDAQLDQQESEIENALLADEWADLEEAEGDLEERAQDVAERETDWLTRKRKLDAREADLDAREVDLAHRDQETADARLAAQNELRETEALNAAQRAEIARLRALREDVERDLAAAGPAPQAPSYDDMRAEFLGEQSAVMTKYLKRMRSKDGTPMLDDFERFAREEHAKLTRQGQPVGRYETWRDRTTAAQKKLTMAQLNDASVGAPRQTQNREFGS